MEASFARIFSQREGWREAAGWTQGGKLGFSIFTVRPVRPGIISNRGNQKYVELQKENLMGRREPREFTAWRNQVYIGMLVVIRSKVMVLSFCFILQFCRDLCFRSQSPLLWAEQTKGHQPLLTHLASTPFPISTALLWMLSKSFMPFLHFGARNSMQCLTRGHTAESRVGRTQHLLSLNFIWLVIAQLPSTGSKDRLYASYSQFN